MPKWVKYIFLENKLPFNKSWSLNCAWKQATNDIIVFGDADNLIDPYNILDSIKEMDEYDFISPHIRLIDLDKEESKSEFEKIYSINRYGRGETDHQKLPMCGAMTIFKKSALDKISGWPEEFFGWGAEDDAMSIKVKRFLKWKEIDNNCYHLYHERVNPDPSWYYRNIGIYNQYIGSSDQDLMNHIENTKSIIGDLKRNFIQQ